MRPSIKKIIRADAQLLGCGVAIAGLALVCFALWKLRPEDLGWGVMSFTAFSMALIALILLLARARRMYRLLLAGRRVSAQVGSIARGKRGDFIALNYEVDGLQYCSHAYLDHETHAPQLSVGARVSVLVHPNVPNTAVVARSYATDLDQREILFANRFPKRPTDMAYDGVSHARASIARYFDFYNRARPHHGLDGATPDEAYFKHDRLSEAA